MSNDTTMSIVKSGNNVVLGWSGGFTPYQLQKCDVLGGPWTNIGVPTLRTAKSQPITGEKGFFRVQQSVPLLDIDETKPDVTLVWEVPELLPVSLIAQPPLTPQ